MMTDNATLVLRTAYNNNNISNNCSATPSPYESQAFTGIAIASAASALFSLLASCFVIGVMVLLKKWRFFSQRLILYLAVAAILTSVATILHRVDYSSNSSSNNGTTLSSSSSFYDGFCVFGGFLEQVTSWIFLNANTSITAYLFASVIFHARTERFEPLYFVFIFIFPLSFNWIPFVTSSYGPSGAWCWIRTEERGGGGGEGSSCDETHTPGPYLIFVLWFVPLYATLSVLLVLYALILRRLYRDSRQWTDDPTVEVQELRRRAKQDVLPLMAYPLIYLSLSIPPLVNRIQTLVSPGEPVLALWYLSAFSFPLEGGLIAVAYALDPETRRRLRWSHMRAELRRCCCCRVMGGGGGDGDGKDPVEYPLEYANESLPYKQARRSPTLL